MILGLGIDLAASEPWRRALEEPSGAALEACFTAGELAAARGGAVAPEERLAARFAAKEAFLKALGCASLAGDGAAPRPLLTDIEVERTPGGCPALVLHGSALAAAEAAGVVSAWLSLSHEGEMAAAVVVLEG